MIYENNVVISAGYKLYKVKFKKICYTKMLFLLEQKKS